MTLTIDTDNIATIAPAAAGLALVALPHVIAAVPALAKASGPLTAILNVLAGNWGAAKNKPVDQQDTVPPKP